MSVKSAPMVHESFNCSRFRARLATTVRTSSHAADHVGDADIDSAFRNAVAIGVLFIPRLTGAAAARFGDLGVNVREGERIGRQRSCFTGPWNMAVDAQLQRSEEPRLTEIVPGETLVLRGLAACVDDEQ
jgi:hypothetical protein